MASMRQAPVEGVQLQKRKFCACLKSILLLQVNLKSMSGDYWVPSGKLGPAVISRIGKKLGVYCYETIPLSTDPLLFN